MSFQTLIETYAAIFTLIAVVLGYGAYRTVVEIQRYRFSREEAGLREQQLAEMYAAMRQPK